MGAEALSLKMTCLSSALPEICIHFLVNGRIHEGLRSLYSLRTCPYTSLVGHQSLRNGVDGVEYGQFSDTGRTYIKKVLSASRYQFLRADSSDVVAMGAG